MDAQRYEQVRRLFQAVIALPPNDRAAYLDDSCADDASLRSEVESLLHHMGRSFLQSAALGEHGRVARLVDAAADCVPPFEGAGHRDQRRDGKLPPHIGHYRILGVLGEGGMGTVYEAEQPSPKRRVALKVIRGGHFADDMYVKRFRREIQALAQLKHSSIAAIYDSGYTEQGQHYYAMELVRGVPLTEFEYRANGIHSGSASTLDAKLSLFRRVCDAINYAHLRGIIHRDLKPSNILVCRRDQPGGTGLVGTIESSMDVKVLDFGLARIVDPEVSAATLVSETGKIFGTLRYMSPEQARGNPGEITFQSDVYALGVLLFELVTGSAPYDLDNSLPHEALRTIIEVEPKRPSVAARGLPGDLETIILKALEKEPARRYASAAALAEDIRRFQDGFPIAARPISALYQLRKFARRNKALVGGVVTAFVLLTLGIIGTSIGMVRAQKAERVAEAESAKALSVSNFLTEMLAAIRPETAQGRDTTLLRSVLQDAERRLADVADQPEVEATLRATIGRTLLAISEYTAADTHLTRALELNRTLFGDRGAPTCSSVQQLGLLRQSQGRFDEAGALLDRALQLRRTSTNPDQAAIGNLITEIVNLRRDQGRLEEAETLAVEALQVLRAAHDGDHLDIASALNNQALIENDLGRVNEAATLYEEALRMYRKVGGEHHPDVGTALNNLGTTHYAQGNLDEAESYIRQALTHRQRNLGEGHSEVAACMKNLASILADKGSLDDAMALMRQALNILRQNFGEDHPEVAGTLAALARILMDLKQYEQAEPILVETLGRQRALLGNENVDIAYTLHYLAKVVYALNRPGEAEEYEREAVAVFGDALGEEHPAVLTVRATLARYLMAQEKWGAADSLYRALLPLQRAVLGDGHARVSRTLTSLADIAMGQNQPSQAEPFLRELLSRVEGREGGSAPEVAEARFALGACLIDLNRLDEAKQLLEASADVVASAHEPGTSEHSKVVLQMIELYTRIGDMERVGVWEAQRSK